MGGGVAAVDADAAVASIPARGSRELRLVEAVADARGCDVESCC